MNQQNQRTSFQILLKVWDTAKERLIKASPVFNRNIRRFFCWYSTDLLCITDFNNIERMFYKCLIHLLNIFCWRLSIENSLVFLSERCLHRNIIILRPYWIKNIWATIWLNITIIFLVHNLIVFIMFVLAKTISILLPPSVFHQSYRNNNVMVANSTI